MDLFRLFGLQFILGGGHSAGCALRSARWQQRRGRDRPQQRLFVGKSMRQWCARFAWGAALHQLPAVMCQPVMLDEPLHAVIGATVADFLQTVEQSMSSAASRLYQLRLFSRPLREFSFKLTKLLGEEAEPVCI